MSSKIKAERRNENLASSFLSSSVCTRVCATHENLPRGNASIGASASTAARYSCTRIFIPPLFFAPSALSSGREKYTPLCRKCFQRKGAPLDLDENLKLSLLGLLGSLKPNLVKIRPRTQEIAFDTHATYCRPILGDCRFNDPGSEVHESELFDAVV